MTIALFPKKTQTYVKSKTVLNTIKPKNRNPTTRKK